METQQFEALIESIKGYEYTQSNKPQRFTSIVVTNDNQIGYLKVCIESIKKFTNKNSYEIIVVDNNSTDENIAYLKSVEGLRIIYNDYKRPKVENFNQGVKIARGENIVLLNIDTILTPGWLDSIQRILYSDENIGIVSPTSNIEDPLNINKIYSSINELLNISKTINTSEINLYNENTSIHGYCTIIKREVVDKIGYLDESFNLGYFKEHDYCFRAIKAGYKVILSKSTFIYYFSHLPEVELDNAYIVSLSKFKKKWGFNLYYSNMVRHDIVSKINNSVEEDLKILEVGCSLGGTLLYLKNKYKNSKIFGIELDKNICEIINKIFPTLSCDIESTYLSYEEDYFDYIIFADVLEHLNNPWKVLTCIKKYLKSDGYIIASIPNIMHIGVVNDLLKGNFTYADAGILDKTHLRFFTKSEIYKLFDVAEYEIESIVSNRVNLSHEEKLTIDNLCTMYGENKRSEYETYQYIIKAKQKS